MAVTRPLTVGPLSVDRDQRRASIAGTELALTPKAFDLLVVLAEDSGRVVAKSDLLERLWPDISVEESNLTQTVFMIRRALRDAGSEADWIQNVPKRGYRLVVPADAPPSLMSDPPPEATPPRRPASRFLVIALLAVLAGAGAFLATMLLRNTAGVESGVRSIAVLPLTGASGPDAQFLAQSITDELVRHIARVRTVRVLGSESSRRTPDGGQNPASVAAQLGVDAVLLGDVERLPSGVRLELRVLDARSGRELWRDHYEGPLYDHGGIGGGTLTLARSLIGRLWPQEPLPSIVARPQDAHAAYLRGRFRLTTRDSAGLRAARNHFSEAVRIDPEYAEAHAGLADAELLSGIFGVDERENALRRAKAAAEQALALDAQNAEALTSLAFIIELLDQNWDVAEALFKRAIAINPSYVQARQWYAMLLNSTLRGADAVREMEIALALDPYSLPLNADLGMVLSHQREHGRAIAQLEKTVRMDPSFASAHWQLGGAYLYAGQYERALEHFRLAEELGHNPIEVAASKLYVYTLSGRLREARAIIGQVEQGTLFNTRLAPSTRAFFLLAAGEFNRALDLFISDQQARDPNLLVSIFYDPVRQDPRYLELVRRNRLHTVTLRTSRPS